MTVFGPVGSSLKVSVTASSQTVELPAVPASMGAIRIIQTAGGANSVYIKLGTAGVSVSIDDGMLIRPYAVDELIGIANSQTHMAILVEAGTVTKISITSGSIIG